jgi:hypothetical protein
LKAGANPTTSEIGSWFFNAVLYVPVCLATRNTNYICLKLSLLDIARSTLLLSIHLIACAISGLYWDVQEISSSSEGEGLCGNGLQKIFVIGHSNCGIIELIKAHNSKKSQFQTKGCILWL